MKTTRFSDHGTQLTRFGFVNCYLVRESDGFTLIDTTLPGAEKDILAAAAALGAPIRRILLTHAHGDHVGSVDALATRLAPLDLAAAARSVPLLQQPPNLSLEPAEPKGRIHGSTPGIRTTVTHTIRGGELYGSLRAIDTPGHIPGHQSFLDERDGTLYAGDELITLGGNLIIAGYASGLFSLFNNFTWTKELALASARTLADYPFIRVASGHGALREAGPAALRTVISSA